MILKPSGNGRTEPSIMTNNNKYTPLSLLMSFLGGCDEYDSVEECRVKEYQKCNSVMCERLAWEYCRKLFK